MLLDELAFGFGLYRRYRLGESVTFDSVSSNIHSKRNLSNHHVDSHDPNHPQSCSSDHRLLGQA